MIRLQGQSQIISRDEVLTLWRDGCVLYRDGKPVKTQPTQTSFRANVQPFNGRDLLMVPEGDRYREQYWLFTQYAVQDNDRIVRGGVNYQVQSVEVWGSYNRARMMRIDVGPFGAPNASG